MLQGNVLKGECIAAFQFWTVRCWNISMITDPLASFSANDLDAAVVVLEEG